MRCPSGMPCQAVLFDLDGTLLDTLDDLAASMNLVLTRLGFPTHPRDAYRTMVGEGMLTLARRALPPTQRTEDQVNLCAAAMREEYGRHCYDTTRPYPGTHPMLENLTAKGLPLAVLSNKPHDLTTASIAAFFPPQQFALVQGAQPSLPLKPDPAGARMIAARLHLTPADFLFVGDTRIDMQTAIAAGMIPVGVLWGFRDAAELAAAGARHLIHKPAAILTLLETIEGDLP